MTNATFEEGVERNLNAKGENEKHQKQNRKKDKESADGENEKRMKQSHKSLTKEKSVDSNKVEDLRGGVESSLLKGEESSLLKGEEDPSLPSSLASHYFRQVVASIYCKISTTKKTLIIVLTL